MNTEHVKRNGFFMLSIFQFVFVFIIHTLYHLLNKRFICTKIYAMCMTSGKKSQKTTGRQFIALDHDVKTDLEAIGKFKDTYGDIVRKLIDFWNKKH